MGTFTWVSGRLTEVHRFINVPMRWCEQYPSRERREVWINCTEGRDLKLVVHTRSMPARCGHEVVCVLLEGQVMGLRNLSTGDQVVFVRSDPPLLWRRCDSVGVAMHFVFALAIWLTAFPLLGAVTALCALLYAPLTLGTRWLRRAPLAHATEVAMASAARQVVGDQRLKLVK